MKPTKKQLLSYVGNFKSAAKKFDVSERTIRRWMKEHDIYEPKIGFGPSKLDKRKAAKIRKLDACGKYTQTELAKMFNVTQATIGRILNNIYYKVPFTIQGSANITWR